MQSFNKCFFYVAFDEIDGPLISQTNSELINSGKRAKGAQNEGPFRL